MKRRFVVACWTIVAAFQLHLSAADVPVSEDVPVPGGTAAFAGSLAIDPVPDRARFMFEVTRLVHDNAEIRNPSTVAFLLRLAPANKRDKRDRVVADPGTADLVPVPLTAEIWSSAVFRRKVAREDLVAAIVADRQASWLCHGLAALDDQTLAYLSEHSSTLTRLFERSAPVFAAFSNSVRIRANRVIPPGGDGAAALWEAVVGEKVTRPDRFITQLFEQADGRVAYLFDTVGQLDGPRRAFALGLWMPNQATRVERFKALATTGISAYREWHVRVQPYGRSTHDLGMTLSRVTADDRGMPVAPASRAFWSRVFSSNDVPDDSERQVRGLEEDPFDAAWLTEAIGSADIRQRADRLDQIAFAQRAFGASANPAEVFVAARAVARYRMLMLTIERIGIRQPALFTAAARHAARLGPIDGHRGFMALAQFQGAVALIARMTAVRTIRLATAEKLLQQLVSLRLNDDNRYAGAVALWMRDAVIPAVPAQKGVEATVIAALSGPPSAADTITRLTWEGQRYKLDLGAAERRRLQIVREKQAGLPIDIAFDVAGIGSTLAADNLTAVAMQAALEQIAALASRITERERREEEDAPSSRLAPAPEVQAILRKAADDLGKAIGGKDVKRAARIAAPLLALSDDLLSQALLSFVYAANLGDPDGAILLADDVSRRHDFGFSGKDAEQRSRAAWIVPRQDVTPGSPWHVSGALLGLEVALAPLALRRLSTDRIVAAPRLTSNQRDAFALSVATLNPFAMDDVQRDAIVDGIESGRRRVATLSSPEDLDAIENELTMEGARRRALAWAFAHDRERLESMLSLTELLVLGGGRLADLDAWGMSMLTTHGCLCSRLTPPGRWSTLSGRPALGVTAAGMADVSLQIAILLKQLQLPAALARVVLSAAMQDFIDETKPTDEADWISMARAARTITAEQVEDYVAAATAIGPLVPDDGSSTKEVSRR